jgi:plasmid stabilization system protein ParE
VHSVSIHPDAVQEYVAAFRWYHERSPGVALRFEANAEQALMFVASHPEASPLCDDVHRYRKIRRYPYGFVYRIVGQTVFVVALAHDRQLPGFWLDRT